VTTTLDRTTIGDWTAGRRVNLERRSKSATGWADTSYRATLTALRRSSMSSKGDARLVDLALPPGLAELWYSTDR
jgi:hypothetical protein